MAGLYAEAESLLWGQGEDYFLHISPGHHLMPDWQQSHDSSNFHPQRSSAVLPALLVPRVYCHRTISQVPTSFEGRRGPTFFCELSCSQSLVGILETTVHTENMKLDQNGFPNHTLAKMNNITLAGEFLLGPRS
jgi:hypothetical protein